MTPLESAEGIADFLRESFAEYDEKDFETGTTFNVCAGFIPMLRANEMKKNCPAIVVRPVLISDNADETTCDMVIFLVTYDEDMERGCYSLYHILEFMRYKLLTGNPVNRKWFIKKGTTETFIPDEQPYPLWEGRIDFTVNLPQPRPIYNFR